MVIITGKTASGKDRIVNELITKHGFHKLITYTTRDIRDGEKQGVTYHYISKKEFLHKIQEDFFAEYKSYDTVFGTWYYGTSLEDLKKADDKTIVILTPEGYRDLVNKLSKKPTIIYIYANNSTIQKRLQGRGDAKEEAERRLKQDNIDFKGVENEVDKIVYNNDGTDIGEVIDKILKFVR